MIKVKKLIRSLVIASSGLFIAATACDAASLSFRPRGTQLDQDEILDFSGNPGDLVSLEIFVDTSGIDTSPNFGNIVILFSVFLDPTELRTVNFPVMTDQSYPENYFSANFPQNTRAPVATIPVKMLNGLINDGAADVTLKLSSAYTRNSSGVRNDVTNLFQVGGGFGSEQTVDFQPVPEPTTQPVPEPTTIFGSALALGVGGWLKRKKSSQQNKTTPQG
jgi:hypothetical protein